jgi:Rhodopirellula transposase DDE domain
VARLLHHMNYTLRVNHKELASTSSPDRDQQFEYISALRTRFARQRLPMISVDTKKRELVGNFKNPGAKWDRSPERVNDHDFRSDSLGVAIPYGIYDLLANRGSVFVGVSHDTASLCRSLHRRLVAARRRSALSQCPPTPHPSRQRRQQRSSLSSLEDRTPITTVQSLRTRRYRGPLPDRHFKVESYRASPVLRDIEKLGC